MKHFLDIGGNVGQTFDYLQTLERKFDDYKFWVFEPSPRHFAVLIEKCKQYKSKYDIAICPFGIGGRTEIRHFFEKDDVMGDSFEPITASDHDVHNVDNGYMVYPYIMDIAEFLTQRTGINDKVILDIDSEGAEYETLASLINAPNLLPRITDIWVEWHKIPNPVITHTLVERVCFHSKINLVHRGIYAKQQVQ